MATHSGILAWKMPWTKGPGGLQSMGLQRVRHDLATKQQTRSTHVIDVQYFLPLGNITKITCKKSSI